jgi:asparaginyl-tRNA synthetase
MKRHQILKEKRIKAILKVQDEILSATRDFLRRNGFIEILPPIIGPVTDPGIRGAKQVSIDYYGTSFKIMSSIILYKQMIVGSLEKIFAVSPNIRLEPLSSIDTERHLAEFRQVDLEQANVTYYDSMQLAERLIEYVVQRISERCSEELETLGKKLNKPSLPLRKLTYEEALDLLKSKGFQAEFGEEFSWEAENALSQMFKDPFFVTDYPLKARGFYYRENPEKPGFLRDFDLIYPEGFGEAVSGGEREYKFEAVVKRMRQVGENLDAYEWYLNMLKDGVVPSAGFGIGVERLTRWVCGLQAIWDAVPFPKVPGLASP